jgi:hypothetical protein
MPKICYASKRFKDASLSAIEQTNLIIAEYAAQGFDLTLRQLYYQFVARDLIPNSQKSYKRLGSIINDARMAGMIDWNTIVDRTRNLQELPHWINPTGIISACANQFAVDKWKDQEYRPQIWIEKDALIGVIAGVCQELDVPYFSCRGYTSQSEMWSAAQRLLGYAEDGQRPMIIHLGDHDPSGIDMSRDITDRIELFMTYHGLDPASVKRIALNMNQIEEYDPPPNPAKFTDSRASGYVARYGTSSWELDALEPMVMADLIRDEVKAVRDEELWDAKVEEEQRGRDQLRRVANNWEDVLDTLLDIGL